jgi:hypothetical protein
MCVHIFLMLAIVYETPIAKTSSIQVFDFVNQISHDNDNYIVPLNCLSWSINKPYYIFSLSWFPALIVGIEIRVMLSK